jgi:hypothetical protein
MSTTLKAAVESYLHAKTLPAISPGRCHRPPRRDRDDRTGHVIGSSHAGHTFWLAPAGPRRASHSVGHCPHCPPAASTRPTGLRVNCESCSTIQPFPRGPCRCSSTRIEDEPCGRADSVEAVSAQYSTLFVIVTRFPSVS